MPKLIIISDDETETQDEEVIDNGNTIIGRAPDCDIVLDDLLVSRHHLRIICILGDCFLEDMNSANGTMVNDRLTNKCPLEHGDTITIGKYSLKYDTANATESTEEEFDKARVQLIKQLSSPDDAETADETPQKFTGDIDLPDSAIAANIDTTQSSTQETIPPEEDTDEQTQTPAQSRVKAENPKERLGNITIISGSRQGHNMFLTKSVTSIDKSGQRVAAVTRRSDGYFLVPLGDGSPDNISVVINGEEVNRRIFPLWSNDIIELDGTEMEFGFSD